MQLNWEDYGSKYEEKIDSRSAFLQNALNYYINFRRELKLSIAEDSAKKISALYFAMKELHVQEFLPGRMNRFKMGALTSFCIVKVQPIQSDDINEKRLRELNAELASICTIALINGMAVNADAKLTLMDDIDSIGNVGVEEKIIEQLHQREIWLAVKNVNSYPVFSSGAFYNMVWLFSKIRLLQTGVGY